MRRTALLLTALTLSGCGLFNDGDEPSNPPATTKESGSNPTRTPTPEPPPPEQLIETLLKRRAAALEKGDTEALERTATKSQRDRDRRTLLAADALQLEDVGYTVSSITVDGAGADIEASFSFAIPNVPGRYTLPRLLKARRAATRWRLTADEPRDRERLPWEVAPVTAKRLPHFVVIHPASLPLGDLPKILERGYDTMDAALPVDLAKRYLVVVGADPDQAQALTSGIAGLDTLASVADSDVKESGTAKRVDKVIAQRLLIVWSNFAPLDADYRETLVTHELTHLALAQQTSGRTPSWLIEGVALLVSDDRRVFEPGDPTLEELAGPRTMARMTGQEQTDAYARASATAFYIDDTFGREAFFALYDSFNDPSLAAPNQVKLVDKALRRVLKISVDKLEADTSKALETAGA